jgi:hypothetical protein
MAKAAAKPSSLVDTRVKANPTIFDEVKFRERLKDNPAVDSLARYGTIPDPAEVERDLALTSAKDPDVSVLYQWRGSIVAHKNADIAKGNKDWTKGNVSGEGLFAENRFARLRCRNCDLRM